MWNDEPVDTLTSQGLQAAGMSRGGANLLDSGASIVGSLGASALTRAPGVVAAGEQALSAGDDVVRAAAAGTDEASSVTLAFQPGLPTGHNMVGVTTGGTTTWSHLVVQSLTGARVRRRVPGGGARHARTGGGLRKRAGRRLPARHRPGHGRAGQCGARRTDAVRTAGEYSYLGNNCTTYATSILREAGVIAPSTNTPATAFMTVALQSPEVVQVVATAGVAANGATFADAAASYSSEEPISMEPPTSQAPAAGPMSTPSPAPQPQESLSEDPASLMCTADGYYDTEEQACYAY